MKDPETIRVIRYLERRYEQLSKREQMLQLEEVIKRLSTRPEYLTSESLEEIAQTLKEDGWSLPRIIAHLDIIDLDDRT
tara:strand:+ start:369 stop:605 length:237 start_codon:yes stop_codon:yes gene_type:complete